MKPLRFVSTSESMSSSVKSGKALRSVSLEQIRQVQRPGFDADEVEAARVGNSVLTTGVGARPGQVSGVFVLDPPCYRRRPTPPAARSTPGSRSPQTSRSCALPARSDCSPRCTTCSPQAGRGAAPHPRSVGDRDARTVRPTAWSEDAAPVTGVRLTGPVSGDLVATLHGFGARRFAVDADEIRPFLMAVGRAVHS